MTRSFVYAREAQAELRKIVRFTARQWGTAQARDYARQIDDAAEDLATGQGVFNLDSSVDRSLENVTCFIREKAVANLASPSGCKRYVPSGTPN